MKKFLSFSALVAAFSMPFIASAATVFDVLTVVQKILNFIIPILITLAVVWFIWGVIQYTVSTDEEAKKGARGKIIQGLIGLFVIISFWGIVNLIINTFDVGPTRFEGSAIPCIPTPSVPCQ